MPKALISWTVSAATAAVLLSAAPAALADTGESSNWAGYAVHRSGVSFSSVSASWTQPNAHCRRGHRTFSAVWVGLGGYALSSRALEQIGSEVDCAKSGRAVSSAWYELVPAASHNLSMQVRPGDQLAAGVTVNGNQVTLALADLTTHASFQRVLSTSAIDVSSAEWIVEAPSECFNANACQTLPLANFGSATFSSVRAVSTTSHAGTIFDPGWDNTKIRLRPHQRRFVSLRGRGVVAGAADPSRPSADGSSFSVSFRRVRVYGKFVPARRTRQA